MRVPGTKEIDDALRIVIDAAAKQGVSPTIYNLVQQWAKSWDVLIRAYFQGGLPQLQKVFDANFPEERQAMDEALSQGARR